MSQWISSPKEYSLTSKIFYKNGKISYLKSKADLNKGGLQNIDEIFLENPISKIETRFNIIEPLSIKLIIKYKNYLLTQLNVGIRNSNDISYIGEEYWVPPSYSKFFQRFFFNHNHEPSGFESLGFGQTGGWPELEVPFITEEIKSYLSNLTEFKPEISKNLEKCVSLLEQHYKKPIKVD